MKNFLFTILMTLTAIFSFAQSNSNIDSLEKLLSTKALPDTTRLKTLTDLSYYCFTVDPGKGILFADSAITLAQAIHNEKGLAAAYDYKGLNYSSQGNDSIALIWLKKSLDIHKERHELKDEAVALQNMGISYSNLSQYAKALSCHQEAYDIFKELNHQPGMAATLNSIGVVYLFFSDYPRALNYYQKSLKIYEQIHDTLNIAADYTNIGLVYLHIQDYKKALQYQLRAMEIYKNANNDYGIQNCLLNTGNILSDSGNFSQALQYYKKAEIINQQLGNKNGLASGFINTGTAYFKVKDYPNALLYLNRAFNLYRSLGNRYGSGSSINYIVNTEIQNDSQTLKTPGLRQKQKVEDLLKLQFQGIKDGEISRNLEIQRDGWQTLSHIFLIKKEPLQAFQSYKKYIVFRDSIINAAKRSEITSLFLQYEFNKKEDSLKAQKEKEKVASIAAINRQRLVKNSIAAGAGIIVLAGILTFTFYKRKRDAEEKKKESDLKAEIAEMETKALRSQMNPHFIFNSLNSISDFINKHDTKTADEYLTKFASLMRMALENSEQKEIPMASELKSLEIYMQLESLRMNHKFSYDIQVANNIDRENTLIPPMMLQPFVENSIWHGIAQKAGKGKILIEITSEENMICCAIEDNGVGMHKESLQERRTKSLGMKITAARIELLNKLRKSQGSLHLSDLAEGTRVEMKLPLILNF